MDYLTFDDVLLEPQYSEISSRADVDLSTSLGPLNLKLPIISANMDTVTEFDMAYAMSKAGGLGILHRFASSQTVQEWIDSCNQSDIYTVVSKGISERDFSEIVYGTPDAWDAICIDIAHADNENVLNFIKRIRSQVGDELYIIAGNVATPNGAVRLINAGANCIKIGIGPGSLCSTRLVTGHGVPQLTAIQNISNRIRSDYPHISIIADGGIKNSGDIVKALAAGADAVMLGSLLAGTEEAPGRIIVENGLAYKEYRGMASYNAQKAIGKDKPRVEGISTKVPYKGPVVHILDDLEAGIRSGLSYSGAYNLQELRQNAKFIKVSSNSLVENSTHIHTQHKI